MDNIYNKFIIETYNELGDCLIIDKCTFHKQLVINKDKVRGGGMWNFIDKNKTIILFGESKDFGKPELKDIKNCILNNRVYNNIDLINPITTNINLNLIKKINEKDISNVAFPSN